MQTEKDTNQNEKLIKTFNNLNKSLASFRTIY
ncbi:hypothetical protein VCHENC02_1209, partial [Vibrio harveyi]